MIILYYIFSYDYYLYDGRQRDLAEKLVPYIWLYNLRCIASPNDIYFMIWSWPDK